MTFLQEAPAMTSIFQALWFNIPKKQSEAFTLSGVLYALKLK